MSGSNVCTKKGTIHCVTRSQVLLYLKSSVNLGVLLHFFFSALFPLHIHHHPVLRGPSAAPQKTGTPALSSLLIKAHENVQSSHRSQPGMVKRSAPQHQSSRTPGSRLISSAFCFRGHTGKGTQADCHNSPQCSLCSGSPFHVIPGVYIHTQSMFGNDYIFVYKFL